jgi:kynureninase
MTVRQQFLYDKGIYLLNHSVGLPPANTTEVWQQQFLAPWQAASEDNWPAWLAVIDGFRESVAAMLGGRHADICPQVNLSSALTKIVTSLSFENEREGLLCSEEDFPSMGFVLQQACTQGHTLRYLSENHDLQDLEVWHDNLTEDVGLALITHVQSNTGRQLPVADITRLCRERGIISVVDVAQSVGVVPIDLAQWQADFVIGSCVKWLCGGPGAGFLWVSPDRINQCHPRDVGWFSHEAPFEFDIRNFRYAPDAMRFWGGTPSIQPYVLATNSLKTINQIGIDSIREHNLTLTEQMLRGVAEEHCISPRDALLRGGTVVLQYPEERLQRIAHVMQEADIAFDLRHTGMRLSPHIYNDSDEIAVLIACLGAP